MYGTHMYGTTTPGPSAYGTAAYGYPLGVQAPAPLAAAPLHPPHHDLEPGDVVMKIRQQPKEALVMTDGKEKSRKPIDPPPIIEITTTEDRIDPQKHYLQSPYLFMVTCLIKEDTDEHVVGDNEAKQALAGTLCSSLHRLKDTNNRDGAFFVFGDVSVRLVGTYRLKFTLYDARLKEPTNMYAVCLGSVLSEPFSVVHAKDFRGLEESTYLSRAFSDQGVRLRLRKEPRSFNRSKRKYDDFQQGQDPYPAAVQEFQSDHGSVAGRTPNYQTPYPNTPQAAPTTRALPGFWDSGNQFY